jgi:hypothetical protein
MTRRRGIICAVMLAVLGLVLAGCSTSSGTGASTGDQQSQVQQQKDTTQLEYVEPLPSFQYSQIRFDLIQVEAIEALGLNSTSFAFMPGITHPVWSCPSIGLPMAATDELSNPVQPQWQYTGGSNGNSVAGVGVGQEDPNGIFQGDTTGTYVLCVDPQGRQYLQYNEGYTDTTTQPGAHWNGSAIVGVGQPVMPVCKLTRINGKQDEVCTKP